MALSHLTKIKPVNHTFIRVSKEFGEIIKRAAHAESLSMLKYADQFLAPLLEEDYRAKIASESQRLAITADERERFKVK